MRKPEWTASMPTVAVPAIERRTRHRRRVEFVASTLALVMLLVACSGSDDASKDQPRSATPLSTSASTSTSASATSAGPATVDCPNFEGGVCLGKLDAGTYSTTDFDPGLTYTVPAGWANYEDLFGQVLLVPPRGTLKGVNADTGDFIGVDRGALAAAPCDDDTLDVTVDSRIGPRPADIANWWHKEPGLVTTPPKPVTIGGLSGLVTDVHLSPSWTQECMFSHHKPTVPLLIGTEGSSFSHGMGPGRTTRFYLLSFQGQHLAGSYKSRTLAIEVPDFSMGKHLAEYDRVVKTFRFGK